jgi:hypothetical protein
LPWGRSVVKRACRGRSLSLPYMHFNLTVRAAPTSFLTRAPPEGGVRETKTPSLREGENDPAKSKLCPGGDAGFEAQRGVETMRLTPSELDHVRSFGLYVTEKCDACGNLLNQTVQYKITDRREVYCSATCRDNAFFGDRHEAKKRATPGRCAYCGGSLKGKKRGALYCDDVCRVRHSRVRERTGTRRLEKSRTPTQSNQRVCGDETR